MICHPRCLCVPCWMVRGRVLGLSVHSWSSCLSRVMAQLCCEPVRVAAGPTPEARGQSTLANQVSTTGRLVSLCLGLPAFRSRDGDWMGPGSPRGTCTEAEGSVRIGRSGALPG